MLGWFIRLSSTVAVGWLLLSIAAPQAVRAAPTPTLTPAPPRPTSVSSAPTPSPRSGPTTAVIAARSPTAVATVTPTPQPPTPTPRPEVTATRTTAPTPQPQATATRTSPTPGTPQPAAAATPQPSPSPEQEPTDEPTEQEAATTDEAALDWHAFVPTDTADHLATMERAARESGCGVPWQLLAAIARVESNFGRNMATSSAGAIGYGQFLPSSWQAFGSDGNVYDYRDALPAMALYLCQAGLARDPRAALFAYNHADWYVDMVLDLAVRYDRIAPGSPIPEVLGVGPPADAGPPMHYAPGRDVQLQSRLRHFDAGTTWIGVPWHGRTPGAPISPSSIEGTTLEMLRGAFGLSGRVPSSSTPEAQGYGDLADRAWAAGLLPLTADSGTWTVEAIRAHLQHSQPVVALLDTKGLPGHPPTEASGDQPVVVIGTTADGLIVSDPTFSSSLGYGLQLSDAEFVAGWQSASSPRRALAFSLRPKPLARQAHVRTAEPPEPFARVVPTPTPVPTPSPTAAAVPTLPPAAPDVMAAPAVTAEPAVSAAAAVTADRGRAENAAYLSWMLLACASVFVAVAVAFVRLRRARRCDGPTGRATTAPRRSGQ